MGLCLMLFVTFGMGDLRVCGFVFDVFVGLVCFAFGLPCWWLVCL